MLESYHDVLTVNDLCEILMIGKKRSLSAAERPSDRRISDRTLLEDPKNGGD